MQGLVRRAENGERWLSAPSCLLIRGFFIRTRPQDTIKPKRETQRTIEEGKGKIEDRNSGSFERK